MLKYRYITENEYKVDGRYQKFSILITNTAMMSSWWLWLYTLIPIFIKIVN